MTTIARQNDPDGPVTGSAPDDPAEDERAGQSTTVEEAMDAATDEEGFAHESAYTPSTVGQDGDQGG